MAPLGPPILGTCFQLVPGTGPGLSLVSSSAVVVARSQIFGPIGLDAASAQGSSLYLFETTAQGGRAPDHLDDPGAGVSVADSFLFASGCTFTGGCGEEGLVCFPGGPGGPGLVRAGGPAPQLLETVLNGGPGGCGKPFCGCGSTSRPRSAASSSLRASRGNYTLGSPATAG